MYRVERTEGRREGYPSLLPSLLAKGVKMSLTGPPRERNGNEFDWPCMRGGRGGEGEEESWVFPALLVIPMSLLRYSDGRSYGNLRPT